MWNIGELIASLIAGAIVYQLGAWRGYKQGQKKSNEEWGEVMSMIADTLEQLGCSCGKDSKKSTPPSFYPEWIECVVRKHKEKK
jgi:hypothetical protein